MSAQDQNAFGESEQTEGMRRRIAQLSVKLGEANRDKAMLRAECAKLRGELARLRGKGRG